MWRGCLEAPIINYKDIDIIMYPIFIIVIIVVFLGSGLRWILFPEPIFLNLTVHIKILNLLLVIVAIWSFFIYFNIIWHSGPIGKYAHFFGGMWFIPFITGGGITYFLKSIKVYHLEIDQAWIEDLEAQLVHRSAFKAANYLRVRQVSSLVSSLKFIFLLFLGLIII